MISIARKFIFLFILFNLFSCIKKEKTGPISKNEQSGVSARETEILPSFVLEKIEKQTIVQIAKDIERQFAPEKFVYIGLGRSPTLVTLALEAHHPGNTLHFPASKLSQLYLDKYTDLQKTLLQTHFDRFFNSLPISKSGKKFLLIDHIQSGLSLVKGKKLFEMFTSPGTQYEMAGLVCAADVTDNTGNLLYSYKDTSDSLLKYLEKDGMKFVTYSDPSQLLRFASERYDSIAKYTFASFVNLERLRDVSLNPEFTKGEKAFIEQLKY